MGMGVEMMRLLERNTFPSPCQGWGEQGWADRSARRMREDDRRQLLLSHRIEQAVGGLLYLVNDGAMCIVECEVGCQDLRARSVDSARAGDEIKDVGVEAEC